MSRYLKKDLKIMNYRQLLKNELRRRKSKNKNYSLRAFARDLGLNHAILSEVLSEKRSLSPLNLTKISNALKWSADDYEKGLNAIKQDRNKKRKPLINIKKSTTADYPILEKWYIMATYNLARMKNNTATAAWIAEHLQISNHEAQGALDLLISKKVIKIEHGRMKKIAPPFLIFEETPSETILNYYRQALDIGKMNLTKDKFSQSQILIGHLILDQKNLKKLGRLINSFWTEVASKIEDPESAHLYTMIVGAFPTKNPH